MANDLAKARIAVIGAGLMGHGIAQVFAVAGHDVTIYDPVMASARQRASRALPTNLKDLGDDQARRRARHAAVTTSRRRCVRPITSSRRCSEDLSSKQQLFAEIEKHVRPDTILASNTSVIPITDDHGAGSSSASARSAPIGGIRPIWCRWSR